MEKPADTEIELHDLIKNRWSPRAFSGKMIEKERLISMLEAARWAPSCFNEQPWHFIVATRDNSEDYNKMLNCLAEANQMWAKSSPVLMISVAKLYFDQNGKDNAWAVHDIGLAVENMAIQGMSLGIYLHQMAGFSKDRAKIVYDIPEGYEPVTAIALGYPGNAEDLPEDLKEREIEPRDRKELNEFVFTDNWGEKAGFLFDEESGELPD